MPDFIPGFVKITEVDRDYNTSRKTVERRRDKARIGGDSATYRNFRLRMRDGEVLTEPSLQQVIDLRTVGRIPEWFVARSWLAKTFGKRMTDTSQQGTRQSELSPRLSTGDPVEALKRQYEETISMLREQLTVEREEKRELLRYAQDDKRTFANVAAQLARALPALEAVNQPPTVTTPTSNQKSSETAAIKTEQPMPRGKSASPNPRRGWIRRLFTGGEKSTA